MTDPLHKMLLEFEEKIKNSTPVVAWYPHGNEVRGPWNRWFEVTEPRGPEKCGNKIVRAEARDDVQYAAMCMTEFPRLLACLRVAVATVMDNIDVLDEDKDAFLQILLDILSPGGEGKDAT